MKAIKLKFHSLLVLAGSASVLVSLPAKAGATSEIAALSHIRALIVSADHDYKGHKEGARHAIDDALKELGVKVVGDAHGHELQGDSDKMLKQAQAEIGSLRPVAEENKQTKILEDLDKADKQLTKALAIK